MRSRGKLMILHGSQDTISSQDTILFECNNSIVFMRALYNWDKDALLFPPLFLPLPTPLFVPLGGVLHRPPVQGRGDRGRVQHSAVRRVFPTQALCPHPQVCLQVLPPPHPHDQHQSQGRPGTLHHAVLPEN